MHILIIKKKLILLPSFLDTKKTWHNLPWTLKQSTYKFILHLRGWATIVWRWSKHLPWPPSRRCARCRHSGYRSWTSSWCRLFTCLAHGTSVCGGGAASRAFFTSLRSCLCAYFPLLVHFTLPFSSLVHSFIPPFYFLCVSYIFTSCAPPDMWLGVLLLRVVSYHKLVISLFFLAVSSVAFYLWTRFWFFCWI